MTNTSFDWHIDEFMVNCRSRQLKEKTMASYEQALRLFERWCREQMKIDDVCQVTESMVRRYINDLQERGKYTFYSNDEGKLASAVSHFRLLSALFALNIYYFFEMFFISSLRF